MATTLTDDVHAAVNKRSGVVTAVEIAGDLGLEPRQVNPALLALAKRGDIHKGDKRGEYKRTRSAALSTNGKRRSAKKQARKTTAKKATAKRRTSTNGRPSTTPETMHVVGPRADGGYVLEDDLGLLHVTRPLAEVSG